MEQQLDGGTGDDPGRLRAEVAELLGPAPGVELAVNIEALLARDDLSARCSGGWRNLAGRRVPNLHDHA
jgi:hypothetical protein